MTDWNAMSDEAFRKEVRAFFQTAYPDELRFLPRRLRWSECKSWYLTLARKGWIAPAWPKAYGGMELSPGKQIIMAEETERAGIGRMPDQGITQVGPTIMRYGTEAQKKKYLQPILAGEHVWCQGYSEPNSGSDLASLQTTAVREGDEFVINGSKIWTSMSMDATHMYILVRTDRNAPKRQEGISFMVLDMKTPGITLRPIRNIAGHEEFAQVFFDNVRVPADALIGELNKGWTIAKALLGFERLGIGNPRRTRYAALDTRRIHGRHPAGRPQDPARDPRDAARAARGCASPPQRRGAGQRRVGAGVRRGGSDRARDRPHGTGDGPAQGLTRRSPPRPTPRPRSRPTTAARPIDRARLLSFGRWTGSCWC